MKNIIFQLFTGVGFNNQLFSLEHAIYLANITNRKLILLIKHPLCHCGKSNWDYGRFLDFFDDAYLNYLTNGFEVHYGSVPDNINKIIQDNNICEIIKFPANFSHLGLIDISLNLPENYYKIDNFLNGRTKYINNLPNNSKEYIFVDKINASRCFYNYFTTEKNYILMSNICKSLTYLHKSFYIIFNNIELFKKYISIHFRFGDKRHPKSLIDSNSYSYFNPLMNQLNNINNKEQNNLPIYVMCDRTDADLLNKLSNKYKIIYVEDLIHNIDYKKFFVDFKNYDVIEFLILNMITANSTYFIGHDGSTVSHYVNYLHYLSDKDCCYYLNKTINYDKNKYSWVNNNFFGANISFRVFFRDNIFKDNIKLITLTNDGYMNLTENLLISMKKIGIQNLLKIYCIGLKSYNYFKKNYCYNDVVLVDVQEEFLKNWVEYKAMQNPDTEGKKKWATITSYKIYAINNELIKGNDVIFTDGDIVFENNPIPYFIDNIGDFDLFIQNDNLDYNSRAMCTGMFYMKSNEKTLKITDFKTVSNNIDNFNNDQQYLRRYENQLKVKYLDLDLFPNGKYYRDKLPNKPYIIHFNYDVSEHKIRRMKSFNKWYLDKTQEIESSKLTSLSSSVIRYNNNNVNHVSEKIETDLPLSKYIESKCIKIRQGYITQVKKHEDAIIASIKKHFTDFKNIKNVLEIGFLAGHSAELFLKLNETLIVHSFDNGAFQSVNVGKKYIDDFYSKRHILIKGDSKQTLIKFIESNKIKFDIILIDGGYDYDTVLSDINNCKNISTHDTFLIVNNVLNNQKWIKYWNKEPTIIFNKLVEEKIIKKIENIDIDIGRGTVIGKYINLNETKNEIVNQIPNQIQNEIVNQIPNQIQTEIVNQIPNQIQNEVDQITIIKSNRNAGFFSCLLGIIYYAFVNIKNDCVPYILWQNPKYMNNPNDNVFDYFFDQKNVLISNNCKIINENGLRINDILKLAKSNNFTFREQMNIMFYKVCKLNNNYRYIIDEYCNKYDIINKFGIHIRRTDRYVGGKGLIYAGPNLDLINKYLINKNINNLYLATDCTDTHNLFSNNFNCNSYASIRSNGIKGIHDNNYITNGNKIKGEEALIESYLLSKCKYLIRTTSNFTIFSLILNPQLSYEDLCKTYKNEIIKEYSLDSLFTEEFLEK